MFEPACVTKIKELIMKSPSKSCELDPVPTSLIKQNIDVFAKYITIIANKSLSSGCFPDTSSQKVAHVKPLLKKSFQELPTSSEFKVPWKNNRASCFIKDF